MRAICLIGPAGIAAMCLILFAWQAHPEYSLVIAANRDEYFHRPAAPAHFWPDRPHILAGRDLEQNGTWLGVDTRGRIAALTNFRNPGERNAAAPSRGLLVSELLGASQPTEAYLDGLAASGLQYNGFNLLVSDRRTLWHYSNRGGAAEVIAPGVHGLSNHLLNTTWPKVEAGKARLRQLISREFDPAEILGLLDDTGVAADDVLPDTGIGLERERKLSAARIVGPGYGTRCSTVLLVRPNGETEFIERTFLEDGGIAATASFRFKLGDSPA